MKTATLWRAGSVSDPGLQRNINEDRVFVDEARGIFMVVDGLGGHAAGETAAETAVEVISREFKAARVIDEAVIRKAITAANNEIFRLSDANASWRGMACVLTLAAQAGEQFLVGHVGDSRLYLFWNGKLQKVTLDHSPVGELEDSGEITEEQAMQHPRRNEVFRDVGSFQRQPNDPRFIDVTPLVFPPDGALLLCSDGLSDLVKNADMVRILERYDGDSQRVAHWLVQAANAAGGRDNISVVFVPGPEFMGADSAKSAEGRSRHATTRMRNGKSSGSKGFLRNLLVLVLGMGLGLGTWQLYLRYGAKPPAPVVVAPPLHTPRDIPVEPDNAAGIVKALDQAQAGDTVLVPAGTFVGPLVLKDRVNVFAQSPGRVIVHADPNAAADPGVAVIARGLKDVRLKGLRIEGDAQHPLRTGLLISDSSIEAEEIEISGAAECGVRITGDSHPELLAGNFHANAGAGVIVEGSSAPRLLNNRIADNGRVKNALRSGIEISNQAQPSLTRNEIEHNGLPAVFPPLLDEEFRKNNVVDPKPVKPGRPSPKSTQPGVVKPNAIGHPINKPLTDA